MSFFNQLDIINLSKDIISLLFLKIFGIVFYFIFRSGNKRMLAITIDVKRAGKDTSENG